jgi:DNA anti-recombination protein RmuC
MDQALIAYFDERFRETSQVITQQVVQQVSHQIQGLREETLRRFEQIDARFEQVDARFREVDRQFGEARDVARQTLVLVEDVRHQLQLVAEG